MPLPADGAADIARGLRDMYVHAEALVLQQMARALARTGEVPGHLDTRLDDQRAMVRELDRILRALDRGAPDAVAAVIRLATNRGAGVAARDLARLPGQPVAGAVADFGRVQATGQQVALARAALDPLGGMTFQIRRWVLDAYARAGLEAASEVAAGVVTRREASRRFMDKLARGGVKGFTDRSGRRWEMGAYAEMVGRTTASQAAREGHLARLRAYGARWVVVSNAPEECEVCRPFEGEVLAMDRGGLGETPDGRRVTTTVAEAERRGLFHPNCRHSMAVYLPGVTKTPTDTADPEGDRLRQKQRAKERRIRELKRRATVAEEFGGPQAAEARRRLREAQADFAQWRTANDRKNLAYRTNPDHR